MQAIGLDSPYRPRIIDTGTEEPSPCAGGADLMILRLVISQLIFVVVGLRIARRSMVKGTY